MSIRGQAFSFFADAASRLFTGKPRKPRIEFKLPASPTLRGLFANTHIRVVGGFLSDSWEISIVASKGLAGHGVRKLNLDNRKTHSNASMANWAEKYLSSLKDDLSAEAEEAFAGMKKEAARWGSSAFEGKTTLADYKRHGGKKAEMPRSVEDIKREQAARMTHLDKCRELAWRVTAQQLAL